MPSPNATPTPITPPRVPLIDPRTGFIDRAWYLFFLSLNQIATGTVDNVNLSTDSISLIAAYDQALMSVNQELQTLPPVVTLTAPDVLGDCCSALVSQLAEMQKQVEALQVQPIVDTAAITAAINAASSAPVTKTADFTVADNETWLINNKSGSTCTVTLPAASAWSGRQLTFKNIQAQTLVSASSNVVPIDSATAGTAILLAVAGNWATMVSDGTNWIIMQQAANNCLLLE
jgi:cell division FtsZ-interacting protein ZapD